MLPRGPGERGKEAAGFIWAGEDGGLEQGQGWRWRWRAGFRVKGDRHLQGVHTWYEILFLFLSRD